VTAVFGLVVRFRLKDESAAVGFDDLVTRTVAEIARREPGTLVYASHTVAEQPLQRIFYELYADRDAFDAHEEQPHTRRFLELRGQYLAGYEVEFVTPLVGKGVGF
jgi:quinol monooxygenase YgiN